MIDYKKDFKDLYLPKNEPVIIDVPTMNYFMVEGSGNPNTSKEYQNALSILYGLSFTIKMSPKNKISLDGYCDYKMFPLEGFWFGDDLFKDNKVGNKDSFKWISMIRQPSFVTEKIYNWALTILMKKHPEYDYSKVSYKIIKEGKCVQILHLGSYDSEYIDINRMHDFVKVKGFSIDITDTRHHHEIYLSDPRRCREENNKTVIRLPIK